MITRLGIAAALLASIASTASAQTMRFQTNVGSFDMQLNPTNDPNLRPLVDNIVAYIGLGRYQYSAVNRAADGQPGTADDFVLQMGGFLAFPPTPDLFAELNKPVAALSPVVVDGNGDGQVDFTSLPNTRGTVSLALQSGRPNSGTSSFFVNLGNNSSLDSQGFVPFARIVDMTTIDRILQLTQRDLSSQAGQPGSLAFTDVPLAEPNKIVILQNVTVLEADPNFSFVGPIAKAIEQLNQNSPATSSNSQAITAASSGSAASLMAAAEATDASGDAPLGAVSVPESALDIQAVPEPSSVALGIAGGIGTLLVSRRRRRITA